MAEALVKNIQHLPVEVLEQIAIYLNAASISAWSETSRLMRNSLNNDWIWKRFCRFDEAEYESWGEPRVKPIFNHALRKKSSLLPMCTWKSLHSKETFLMDNWIRGNYKLDGEIEIGPDTLAFHVLECGFYGNHHVFFQTKDIAQGQTIGGLWNIQNIPFSQSTQDIWRFINIHSFEGVRFFLKEKLNKIVVSSSQRIHVFDIEPSVLSSNFDHKFKKQKKDPKLTVALSLTVPNNSIMVAQHYFVVSKNSFGNDHELYIWDINEGTKVKSVPVPSDEVCHTITDCQFVCRKDEKHFIVKLITKKHRKTYHYYGFDLSAMEFSSFKVQVNYCDFVLFANDRVVGVGPRRLYLYNYLTSEQMERRTTTEEVLAKSVVLVGNHVLYGQFDNTVFVLDLATFVTVNKVKLDFTLYSLKPILNSFVVVNSNNSLVMEIGKKVRKMFNIPIDAAFQSVNESGTKVAIKKGNKLIIMNFW